MVKVHLQITKSGWIRPLVGLTHEGDVLIAIDWFTDWSPQIISSRGGLMYSQASVNPYHQG